MATAQEITSEIARLQDRLRIARNGLSSLDRNLQSNRAIIARYTEEVAAIPGQILALQVQLRSVLAPVSAGAIAGNANLAREENANPSLPTQPPQIITLDGRIKPAGSGPDGVGQISGTNTEPTPTQQNNPTVGTNDAVRPISQTQAINNQDGQLISVPNNAIAATGGPGAGTNADAGGTVPTRANSPSPQYRARNQSYVYQAIQVVSVFKQGRFEQSLKGILYTQQTANTTQTNAQQREVVNTTSAPITTRSTTKTQQTRPPITVGQLPVKQQAAIATGTDPNTVNDQGMAFGGGGL
mgnify:CR=1 FL=1